ncbi:MAG: M23 family metallopeptidase [Oscillospiraceae bacterium]|nr:M23 family metallopeptidase [Oscillospiraceae bacterium]
MKRNRNNEKQKRAIYSAAAIVLCAAALGSFWLTNRNVEKADNNGTSEHSQVITTEAEPQVNVPVTNIPDDRETETTKAASCYFALPSENNITKHFSGGEMVKNTTTDDWRAHLGLDIAGKVGDPVKAICDGTVTDVRDDDLWGTIVTVDHGNGIISEYRGLGRGSTPDVGTQIKINDKVGNLGEIPVEKADGVHLHIEIREKGNIIDPEKVIGQTYEFK